MFKFKTSKKSLPIELKKNQLAANSTQNTYTKINQTSVSHYTYSKAGQNEQNKWINQQQSKFKAGWKLNGSSTT